MGPPETTIIAIRISLVLIRAAVGLRTLLFDWRDSRISKFKRDQSWRWLRASIVLQAVCITLFYSPADALLALGHVDATERLWLSVVGSSINCLSGVAALVALDIATNHNRKALPFYLGIIAVPLIWITLR